MLSSKSLVLFLCCLLASSISAFTFQPLSNGGCALKTRLHGMAQPETQIKTKTKVETQTKQKVVIKKKEKTDDPVSRREEDFQDAPMFKVMLLEDGSYDAEHVVTRLCGKFYSYISFALVPLCDKYHRAHFEILVFSFKFVQLLSKIWMKMPLRLSFNKPCKKAKPCAASTPLNVPSCSKNNFCDRIL